MSDADLASSAGVSGGSPGAADLSSATVGQLLIPVSNLEASIEFYRDKLGVKFLFQAPPQMAFFQAGSVRLLVGVHTETDKAQQGSQIYFFVADIQAVFATLLERGVNMMAEPHVVHRTPASELWLCEFRDLDGNQLALMSEVGVVK